MARVSETNRAIGGAGQIVGDDQQLHCATRFASGASA
jgi:hypothetical protein